MSNYIPKKYKYKKLQKQTYRFRNIANNNFTVNLNTFIVKNLNSKRYYSNQFESFRRVYKRFFKKQGILKGYFIFDLPITRKSNGIRMGKGKGNITDWVSNIPKGKVLYSLSNINYFGTFNILVKSSKKISGKLLIKYINIPYKFLRLSNKFYY